MTDDGPQLPEKPAKKKRGRKSKAEQAEARKLEKEQQVIDLKAKREELEALRREALSYGYALEGESLGELRQAVERMRAERQGKPPCYRRSYASTAPQCRICDLRVECAGGIDEVPAYVEPGDLQPVACRACEHGMLRVELMDEATGTVRDYACSSPGCTNTLLGQSRWPTKDAATVYDLTIPPDQRDPRAAARDRTAADLKRESRETRLAELAQGQAKREIQVDVRVPERVPVEVMDQSILEYVRANQPVMGKEAICRAARGSRTRVKARLDWMVKQGILRRRKRVYRLNEDKPSEP